MALRDYLVGEVVDDFADGLLSRREALRHLGLLGLGLSGAATLLAACGGGEDPEVADPTGPSTSTSSAGGTAPNSSSTSSSAPPSSVPRAGAGTLVRFPGPAGELQGVWAPAVGDVKGAVLVIHENRGLVYHFYDVVGRLGRDGYAALCVDLLSREGGTTSIGDPAAVPAALSAAPSERLLADLRAGLDELARRAPGEKLGTMGFCFGGGMAWNLLDAGEARLAAVVPFYGPAPAKPDFSRARAAVLGIYGELDGDRVNGGRDRARAALAAAKLTHEIRTFPGVGHAFFNDTGQRYDANAAREAYAAVLDWFGRHLS